MWQNFITQASSDSAFVKSVGMTRESMLFLNEAVGPGGEASNDAAHDFDNNAALKSAISSQLDIKEGLHTQHWNLYYEMKCSNEV